MTDSAGRRTLAECTVLPARACRSGTGVVVLAILLATADRSTSGFRAVGLRLREAAHRA
jgi:hypothetical protein